MSILGQIQWWTSKGALLDFAKARGVTPRRRLYVVPEVMDQLASPWATGLEAEMAASLTAAFENFVLAGQITVSMAKKPDAMLRRLTNRKKKKNKVWEFRIKRPQPGARVLGLFAEKDCLICTEALGRDVIDFDVDARHAEAAWNKHFPQYEPLVSENVHDYLSSNFLNLR